MIFFKYNDIFIKNIYIMKEEEIILFDTNTYTKYIGKIREKNNSFILKIYDKNEIIRVLNYVGDGNKETKCSYKEII